VPDRGVQQARPGSLIVVSCVVDIGRHRSDIHRIDNRRCPVFI
jgi:hypothetical protein